MSERRVLSSLLRAAVILVVGGVVGAFFVWTAPKTEPEEETRGARIVETIGVAPSTERVSVTAFGPVVPARRVTIKPEVGGRVVAQHEALVPGGFIAEGEELIRIDPADYQLQKITHQTPSMV